MNILIHGSAGVGKSYLVQRIVKASRRQLAVTASTGIAAINIGGVTLHRLMGLGLCVGQPEKLAEQMLARKKLVTFWRYLEVLVIDEISMLDIAFFLRCDKILRLVREDNRPWGGISLVLVGDFAQLPPVQKYMEEDRVYTYLFEHPLWEEMNLKVLHLTESRRTSDQDYFDVLSDVRVGLLSERVKGLFERCSRKPKANGGIVPTILIATNKEVDSYNMSKLRELPDKGHTYSAHFETTVPDSIAPASKLRDDLRRYCMAPESLELKVGAQVMLLVNTLDDSLCNGSRGVVTGWAERTYRGSDIPLPIVRFANGKVFTIDPHVWESGFRIEDRKYKSRWQQLPLRLAWAITIHKSQGLTLDSAYLSLSSCFAPGMMYVALSRCRSPDSMYIRDWDERSYTRTTPSKQVKVFLESIESTVTEEEVVALLS